MTEVGLIPNDWKIENLSSLGKFSKGQGIRKDEALSGDIPCIRYGELYTRHNDYIKQYYSFITQEISEKSKKLKPGDILFAGSGETKEEIGKCAAFIHDIEAYAGGDIVILSPHNISSMFLGYLLNAPIIQKQKASKGQGDAIVHISANQLGSLQIPLPPTNVEQSAIANALSDTDALIENLEKLIAKKRNIKQGAMQELLSGRKRLAGFNDSWNIIKLGDLGTCFSGGTPSTFNPNYWNGNIIWLPSGRIQNNRIYEQGTETTITQMGLDESAAKIIKPNSVLIAITGATCGNIGLLTFEASANQSVIAIEPNNKNDAVFLYYLLLQNRKSILSLQTGSAQGGVNLNSLRRLELCLPTLKEQRAIGNIIFDMDTEIEELENKLWKFQRIKKGMMQVLLTGKIRLV